MAVAACCPNSIVYMLIILCSLSEDGDIYVYVCVCISTVSDTLCF